MRKYLYIGCGSFIGAVLRYLVKGIQLFNYNGIIPLNTLLINVSGALVMAFIMTIAFEVWEFDPDIRLGITTGFLGAFTTFSTLCKETVVLLQNGDYFSAVSYMTISAVLGLGAAYLGVALARGLGSKIGRRGASMLTDTRLIESEVDS